jgi:acylphosphatase
MPDRVMPDRVMPADLPARLHVTVRGRVQGVGFRAWVRRRAVGLRVDGWVANRSDGGVECVAEGPRADLELLLGMLEAGPPGAYVEDVRPRWAPATGGLSGFEVRVMGHPGD